MKTKHLFFLLIIGAVCSSCTKEKYFSKLNYEGIVVDNNENPVQGVTVILDACGGGSADAAHYCPNNKYRVGSSTTDASGHFNIKGKESRGNNYFVTILGQVTINPYSCTKDGLPTKLYSH